MLFIVTSSGGVFKSPVSSIMYPLVKLVYSFFLVINIAKSYILDASGVVYSPLGLLSEHFQYEYH